MPHTQYEILCVAGAQRIRQWENNLCNGRIATVTTNIQA